LILPAAAATIVAWAVLGGGPERVRYVQVLGGPTREGATLAILLRALEQLDDERRVPIAGLAVRVAGRAGNASANATGSTDAGGLLELRLHFGAPPAQNPHLRVDEISPGRPPLAEGELALDVEPWRASARSDGGWLPGQAEGELHVRVAAESGAFAVPFAGAVLLDVLAPLEAGDAGDPSAEAPVPGALARVELDGGELVAADADEAVSGGDAHAGSSGPSAGTRARAMLAPPTDDAGRTRVLVRPLEHAVSARVSVQQGARSGSWYGALPVIRGALMVTRLPGALAVRAPIARERAFISIVSRSERIAGAVVPLVPDPDGSASGSLALDPELEARVDAEPTWAVVSSEFDKRSPAFVGWPLSRERGERGPHFTFAAPDQVLLDGRLAALAARDGRRRQRRSIAAAGLLGVGALLGTAFWNEVQRSRRAPALRAVGPAGVERLPMAPVGWVFGIALGCIVFALAALAYFGWSAP
jgi:hypothetical protein